MTSAIHSITFDCACPTVLAAFWSAALGYPMDEHADDDGASVSHPDGVGPRLLFLPVPEGKTVKNRVHLDLRPPTDMDTEVERLVSLGARKLRRVAEYEDDIFTVMQDPEGNEFCIEQR